MSETSTVVELVDYDKKEAVLSHPNYVSKFKIVKIPYQYNFFKVIVTEGAVPKKLQGVYTSLDTAIKEVTHYLNTSRETQAAKNERLHQERQERRNAPKSDTSDSKQTS